MQIAAQDGPSAVVVQQLGIERIQLAAGQRALKVFFLSALGLDIGHAGDDLFLLRVLKQTEMGIDIALGKMDEDAVVDLFDRQQGGFDLFHQDLSISDLDAVGTSFDDDRDVVQHAFMAEEHFALIVLSSLALQHAVDAGAQLCALGAHPL